MTKSEPNNGSPASGRPLRNVLIVTYLYAPTNDIGVVRPLKFVKYLPFYGYRPIVITCGVDGHKTDGDIMRYPDKMVELEKAGGSQCFLYRGMRSVLWHLGMSPGYRYLWQRRVLREVEALFNRMKIDLVFATHPVVENLTIGLAISKRYGIPLVADFRDGLVFEPILKVPLAVMKMYRHLEREIARCSAAVVSISDPLTEHFRDSYPGVKALTITNGFDQEDHENLHSIKLEGVVNVVFTGRLSRCRPVASIEPLLRAIDLLATEERRRLVIHMVGDLSDEERTVLTSAQYRDVFRCMGKVSRDEALAYQISADVLFLVAGRGIKSAAPGKLFEYLATGKPIFCLTKESTAEKIIADTHTGLCVDPESVDDVVKALRTIINGDAGRPYFNPDSEAIARTYSRKELTNHLAGLFDGILGSG